MPTRDITYGPADAPMIGCWVTPEHATTPHAAVLLIPDAFGLTAEMIAIADDLAEAGYPTLIADMWGGRRTADSPEELGPLIGAAVADHAGWMERVASAHHVLAAGPEVDPTRITVLGYCFGGSSALEYARTGGDIHAVAAIHPGLDLIDFDWSGPHQVRHVLLSCGADDPMATAQQRAALQQALSKAEIDWELDLYGGTKHGFTSTRLAGMPPSPAIGYHERNAARTGATLTRFLAETLASVLPTS